MVDIEKSISMAPGNSYAYRNRALIYMEKDEDELACADLLTALNLGFSTYYGEEVAEFYEKHCE
jgi:Tfp pilus assembly protein PilF